MEPNEIIRRAIQKRRQEVQPEPPAEEPKITARVLVHETTEAVLIENAWSCSSPSIAEWLQADLKAHYPPEWSPDRFFEYASQVPERLGVKLLYLRQPQPGDNTPGIVY